MSKIVASLQHFQPNALVNAIVRSEGGFQYLARRARGGRGIPLVGERFLEQLPSKLELERELVDDAAHHELVASILLAGPGEHGEMAGEIIVLLHR